MQKLQYEILEETGIHCSIGIGSNMLLSKVAMDIEAKHTNSFIAEWRYQDVPHKLWPISPLSKFWGISKNRSKMNKRGIFTRRSSALSISIFKRDFGTVGGIYTYANGIDQK